MTRPFVCLIVAAGLLSVDGLQAKQQSKGGSGSPRVFTLAIAPSRLEAGQEGPPLLVKADEQTDGDGAVLYGKAAQALPTTLDRRQLSEWAKMPLKEMPQDRVRAVLEQGRESLELAGQGAMCKGCTWPPFVPGIMVPNLSEYRQLTYLLCLKARLQIAEGHYDEAISTLRTGLTMSKHIGEAPTVMQGMVGVAMASLLLRPVEDLAQTEGAANLYPSLHALPRPLIDLNVPMSAELKNLESNRQYNVLVRRALRRQLEESYVRVRVLMNRLDSHVAALQCIEALRHYAATHDGKLPARLSEITEVQVPDDPTSEKPFGYRSVGGGAVLEVPVPKGGTARDATRYEIAVAR